MSMAIAVLTLLPPAAAFAYSPSGAAAYADQWALSTSGPWPEGNLGSTDCANFVSTVLNRGGGYPYHGAYGSPLNDDHYWFTAIAPRYIVLRTNSFIYAPDLKQFLQLDGNSALGVRYGDEQGSSSGASVGDPMFMDWTNDGIIDHVQVRVGYGLDTYSGWRVGDLIDQHSPGRLHVFWSVVDRDPYNAPRTRIYTIHVTRH